jgi:hypothetical protein
MRRREFLAVSVGGLVTGVVASSAFCRSASSEADKGARHDDSDAAARHDKERRFAQTAFGRIAYIFNGNIAVNKPFMTLRFARQRYVRDDDLGLTYLAENRFSNRRRTRNTSSVLINNRALGLVNLKASDSCIQGISDERPADVVWRVGLPRIK